MILWFQRKIKWPIVCKMPQLMLERHTHPFNSPLSGTTRVRRYQKGKTIWIFLEQETVSGSGISWAVCKSAPRSRQISMPAPHHSVVYRPDALPAAQPTASKHWRREGWSDSTGQLYHRLNLYRRRSSSHIGNERSAKSWTQATAVSRGGGFWPGLAK